MCHQSDELEQLHKELDKQVSTEDESDLTASDVADVVSIRTGIPVSKLTESEKQTLLKLPAALHQVRLCHVSSWVESRMYTYTGMSAVAPGHWRLTVFFGVTIFAYFDSQCAARQHLSIHGLIG